MAESRDSIGAGRAWMLGAAGVLLVCVFVGLTIADGQILIPGDSPSYLSSAENLVDGDGYVTDFGDRGKPIDFDETMSPVVDFPVGYPVVLGLGVRMGLDVETAAIVLAILCVAGTGGLFLTYSISRLGPSARAVILAVLAAVLTVPYAFTVLSDALFALLVAGSVMALSSFVRSGRESRLAVAALLAVVSVTVRTVGLAVVGVVVVAGWLRLKNPVRRWMWPLATLGAGALVFLRLIGGGSRVIAWHPPDLVSVKVATAAVVNIFVPPVGQPEIRLVLLLIGLLALGVWIFSAPSSSRPEMTVSSGWWPGLAVAAAQIGVVLVTRTLFDAQTDLNSRLLFPVVVSLLVASIEYMAIPAVEPRGRRGRGAAVALLSAALIAGSWLALSESSRVRGGGLGIASASFTESPSVALLSERFDGARVFANVPDSLWVAGVPQARPLPIRWDPLSLLPSDRLGVEMARLEAEVVDGAALFFYREHHRDYMITESDGRQLASCVVLDDGQSVILVSPAHPDCPTA